VPVVGIDLSSSKVDEINAGHSYIPDVPSADIAALVKRNLLRATCDYAVVSEAEAIFICVPTPYYLAKAPDLSFIVSAAEGIVPHLRRGHLVVLQSTTYPGTTDEVVLPILERSGLTLDADFDLAVTNEGSDNISVLRGYGDGRFQAATNYAAGMLPRALCTGDFDADGDNDLAVVSDALGRVSIFSNIANGDFICGDINDDGLINLQDALSLIDFIYRHGYPPVDRRAGDINGSGVINIQDFSYLIRFLYRQGPEPACRH
jgi:hypothetical protein